MELFKEYSKSKEINKALNDNLYREIRFNIEMFGQIDKKKGSTIKLIGLLRTNFYDYLKDSLLDIELIVENKDFFRPNEIDEIYGDNSKAKKDLKWDYDNSFFDVLDILIDEKCMLKNEKSFAIMKVISYHYLPNVIEKK